MAAVYSTMTNPSLYVSGGSGLSFRISGEYTWDSGTDNSITNSSTNPYGLYSRNSTNCTSTSTIKYTSVPLKQLYDSLNITTSATTDFQVYGNTTYEVGTDYSLVDYPLRASPAYDDAYHSYESAIKYLDYFISDNGNFVIGKKAEYRNKIRSNLVVCPKHRGNLIEKPSESEQVALDTLREVISEKEFRKYLRYGFVLVKGQSGDTYQIFRNREHTRVWRGGKVVEEVCVRIKDRKVPPTDNVVAFKTIIECSEDEFKRLGNVYKIAA
jgi:hypothetical protein